MFITRNKLFRSSYQVPRDNEESFKQKSAPNYYFFRSRRQIHMRRWWKWSRLLLLLDLTVVDIFFILVRIEAVVVVSCNLFITQKIWKKKSYLKDMQGSARNVCERLFWRGFTVKATVNFNPAFYARLVLIQSATLSLGTGAMLWERIWNEMLFHMDKWPAIHDQQVH